ncbi:GPI mannosyltransferase 2 [Armadillidium nasatum]|uniref:GPI mannosyltransferase 2 n=1 Tax=Armadillidium nasatum TaxID=96803 RepID=A0A5N5SK54_9CRUS|nr:GPI mannosyltransferase 2 [Armadillidium nasatum]
MATYTLTEKVRSLAILSRLVVFVLQAVSNFLIPDHNADAFVSPPDPHLPHLWGDTVVEVLFGGMKRWDAQYFLHIAQYGYTHENTLVFFPLFPMLVRGIGTVLHIPLHFFCNYYSCLILGAIFLNYFLFVKTAVVFFRLSKEVLRHEALAYKAALLFCINPASIFFSAPYSEALYSFLVFSALFSSESKNSITLPFQFSFASAVRSNGLVNVGFLIHKKLQDCAAYFSRIRNAITESGKLSLIVVIILTFNYTLIPSVCGMSPSLSPVRTFPTMVYCNEEGTNLSLPPHLELYLRANFLHSPDLGEADWCYNFPPVAYSHIQEKYWEVGVFRYYELRQVPNFLLALPVVMTVICHAALYMVDNSQVCLSLGIPPQIQKGKEKCDTAWCKEGINSWRVFVYSCHSLFMCLFCVLFIHVQVTTRLLCSSSPVVYWFAAHLLSEPSSRRESESSAPIKGTPNAKFFERKC